MPDKTYHKTIPGTKSLTQIARLIHQEELEGLSAFRESTLAIVGVEAVNLITFEEVGVTNVPSECEIVKKGEQPSTGATKEWSGIMLASKNIELVDLYRLPEE